MSVCYVYTHTLKQMYYIHTCIHTYIHTSKQTMHQKYQNLVYFYTSIVTIVKKHLRMYIPVCMYIYIYIYIYIYTHTHTYMHTYA